MRRSRHLLPTALMLSVIGGTIGMESPAIAEGNARLYVLAIGNNALPAAPNIQPDEELRPLHYADDDAAAFFEFTRELAYQATLLSVLDADSQRRYPALVSEARPPTLRELRTVLDGYRARFAADRAAGYEPELVLFFSGHGSRAENGDASLAFLDGALSQRILYSEVLEAVPARWVHLIIDACYSDAVVRARDARAQTVELSDREMGEYLSRTSLARFPHVGAVLATSSQAQAHEWDEYRSGVFTHQLLSGLRGGADVNADGRIEYSEIVAFMGAANREVTDSRVRLQVIGRPPAIDRRHPLMDIKNLRRHGFLVGDAGRFGSFHIEDEAGIRYVDVYAEPGFRVALAVPLGKTFYVQTRTGQATFRLAAEGKVMLESLQLAPESTRSRGALAASLKRGLFAAPFGPTYYRGFVDQSPELVAVSFPGAPADSRIFASSPVDQPTTSRRPVAWGLGAASAALGVGAAILGARAWNARNDYNNTQLERPASQARARFEQSRNWGIAVGGAALVAGGVAWLLFSHAREQESLPELTLMDGGAEVGVRIRF